MIYCILIFYALPALPARCRKDLNFTNGIKFLFDAESNKMGCGIPAEYGKLFDYSGAVITVNVVIPENAKAGDFYSGNFSKYLAGSHMSVDFSDELEDRCDESSFTKLIGGGIRITDKSKTTTTTTTTTTITASTPTETTTQTSSQTEEVTTQASSAAENTNKSGFIFPLLIVLNIIIIIVVATIVIIKKKK